MIFSQVTLITLSSSTTSITLSLFLRTSTTFSQSSSFTKIPTPSISSLFPDHRSLHLLPLIPTNRVFCPLHHVFCRQHIFTFFSFNCSHTLPYLFHKNFQLPNLTSNFCNLEIFSTPAHLRPAGDWGPILLQTFS